MAVMAQQRERTSTAAPRKVPLLRLALFFVLLVCAFIGLGMLIVHVLSHGVVGTDDRSIERTLAHDRTPTLDSVTNVTTWLAETPTIVGLTAALALIARMVWKRWRDAIFAIVAVAGETSAFLLVTLIVHRHRPPVPHLDPAPPTSSFPSGHTAAAVAFYGALAVLCAAHLRKRLMSVGVWLVAVLVPLVVAVSRMYRGMHFPTDVLSGAALGALWLAATVIAFRPGPAADRGAHRGSA